MILTVVMFVVMLISLGFLAKQANDCAALLDKYRNLVQEQRKTIDELLNVTLKAITPPNPVPPAEGVAEARKKRGRPRKKA